MVKRVKSVNSSSYYLGLGVSTGIFAFALCSLIALFAFSEISSLSQVIEILGDLFWDNYFQSILLFTVIQAFLSASLSVGLGYLLAQALHRRLPAQYIHKLNLFLLLPFIMPSILLIFALIDIYGRNGWVSYFFQQIGWEYSFPIYGYTGIIMAHVFLNMPYACRIFLIQLQTIPQQYWRLTQTLSLSPFSIFRLISYPYCIGPARQVFVLIFMLCFTSFAIVLTLGSSPFQATLEVAIYYAIKIDFELARGAIISLLQIVIGLLFFLIIDKIHIVEESANAIRQIFRRDKKNRIILITDCSLLIIGLIFIALPFLALLFPLFSFQYLTLLESQIFWQSLFTSLYLSLISTFATMCVCLIFLYALRTIYFHFKQSIPFKFLNLSLVILLIFPHMTLGTGLFLFSFAYLDPYAYSSFFVIILTVLFSLPFCLKIMQSSWFQIEKHYGKLCSALNLNSWKKWLWIEWPLIQKPFSMATCFAFLLSFGDLSSIALFSHHDFTTLPFLLYQKLGTYAFEEAGFIAAIMFTFMILFCLLISKIFSLSVRSAHD